MGEDAKFYRERAMHARLGAKEAIIPKTASRLKSSPCLMTRWAAAAEWHECEKLTMSATSQPLTSKDVWIEL